MITAEARIDLQALRHNYQVLKQSSHADSVVAVVKGDAYGHGAQAICQALPDADQFAVSRIEEATELRQAGVTQPILLLEGCFCQEDLTLAAQLGFETVIHSPEQLDDFLTAKLSKPIKAWLKIDTGMHRIGVAPEQVDMYTRSLSESGNLEGELNFVSHFSCADNAGSDKTARQLQQFKQCVAGYKGKKSIANSAALLNHSEAHFDLTRAGISLYGIAPDEGRTGSDYGLRPVMTLQSKLISVRTHRAGQPVGYGEHWVAEQDTRIGVVALGYGDGYPRVVPPGTPVWVNGRLVPISGRVSMDMITVDLGPDALDKPGDRVEFWGDNLAVEKVASHIGTIPYELTIKLARRVVKSYS